MTGARWWNPSAPECDGAPGMIGAGRGGRAYGGAEQVVDRGKRHPGGACRAVVRPRHGVHPFVRAVIHPYAPRVDADDSSPRLSGMC